jgi:hypothetical protein
MRCGRAAPDRSEDFDRPGGASFRLCLPFCDHDGCHVGVTRAMPHETTVGIERAVVDDARCQAHKLPFQAFTSRKSQMNASKSGFVGRFVDRSAQKVWLLCDLFANADDE